MADQETACGGPLFDSEADPTKIVFNLLLHATCSTGEPRLFLFVVSSALPIALLAFGDWKKEGTLLLAVALLVSVIGFELMTNALRQAVSLAFLLAAVSLENKVGRIVAVFLSVLVHESSVIFAPWVLLVNYPGLFRAKIKTYATICLLLICGLGYYFLDPKLAKQVNDAAATVGDYLGEYQAIYSIPVRAVFMLFMLFPVCWVFGVRWMNTGGLLSRNEKLTFYYSALALAVAMIFFPFITFRIAMTAAVVQLFMAMRSAGVSIRCGAWAWSGLAAHLLIYAVVSPNVRAVLSG